MNADPFGAARPFVDPFQDGEESGGRDRKVAKRWTPRLVAGGWTAVSDFFLENYHRLVPPPTNSEAMLVIHLMKHKWGEAPPRPAYKTLAKRMSMTPTAVRNHARNLEKKGYLRRVKRVGRPNMFHLEPLFEKLEELIPVVEKEKAAAEAAEIEEKQTG